MSKPIRDENEILFDDLMQAVEEYAETLSEMDPIVINMMGDDPVGYLRRRAEIKAGAKIKIRENLDNYIKNMIYKHSRM